MHARRENGGVAAKPEAGRHRPSPRFAAPDLEQQQAM